MDRRNFLKAASGFALLAAGSMAGVPRAFAEVPKADGLAVGHAGVAGHDPLLACMSKNRYTNQGVKDLKRLSVHLVSRGMLPEADYVGHAKRRILARLRFSKRMRTKRLTRSTSPPHTSKSTSSKRGTW